MRTRDQGVLACLACLAWLATSAGALPAQPEGARALLVTQGEPKRPVLLVHTQGDAHSLWHPDGRQVAVDPGSPVGFSVPVAVEQEGEDDLTFVLVDPAGDRAVRFPPGGIVLQQRGDGFEMLDADFERVFPPEGERIVLAEPSEPEPPEQPDAADSGGSPTGFEIVRRILRDEASLNDPSADLGDVFRDVLEDPETLNGVLGAALSRAPDWRFLEDLELELKTFTDDDNTSLGIGFAYDGGWNLFQEGDGRNVYGLSYALDVHGNVAFEQELNPEDFMEAELSLDFFQSLGGIDAPEHDPDPTGERFVDLAERAATYQTDEEFLASDEWKELSALAQSRFTTQYYWEIGINAAVESNQSLTDKNFVAGAHAALDIKAWRRESLGAWLNLADHPFALVRTLSGYDETFTPRGSTIPTLLVGFDRVEPDGNDPRNQAGDSSGYQRLRVELAFKTPIARTAGNEFFFVADWRYYYEVDAAPGVEAAGLDEFDFIYLALESENGIYASYNEGMLPLGAMDREFFEIGWRLSF